MKMFLKVFFLGGEENGNRLIFSGGTCICISNA